MHCEYCEEGVPHAPHTCGRTDLPPRKRGIRGKAVNHWWHFSPCGTTKDEPCRKRYAIYCTTHGA